MSVGKIATGVITAILAIIIVFALVSGTAGTLVNSSTDVAGSGLPLAGLFSSNGIVLLIFMAGILLAVVGLAMKMGKHEN